MLSPCRKRPSEDTNRFGNSGSRVFHSSVDMAKLWTYV
jgi:hypothetical protein